MKGFSLLSKGLKILGGVTVSNELLPVKVSIVRGGTSRAVFIMDNELPNNENLRDKIILAIFGSPSLRQLDGLGGADITTSKLAIIGPSSHPEADVDYTFGQVSMDEPLVDYKGNCGNISSGVGPYAINMGLVKPIEPITTVRIHMTNSHKILIAKVRVQNGKACVDGDCAIGGVPGTGSRIDMDWSTAWGTFTGKLLPTGKRLDEFEIEGKKFKLSVVDAGNIVIYIKAQEFGLTGTETPAQINSDENILQKIERLRGLVSEKIGLVKHWSDAIREIPYQPFFCLITEPVDYDTYTGEHVRKKDVDIVARMYLMGSVVKAFPGTATACTGFAARIKDTLVYSMLSENSRTKEQITIGHPTGIITVTSIHEDGPEGELPKMKEVSFIRTARVLMEGITYVRKSVL
jgi:2-methylaconitate cis-trans-isomerase PrpF